MKNIGFEKTRAAAVSAKFAHSTTTDNTLQDWRMGGRRQRTKFVLFTLAMLAMVLLAIRIASSAPLPQAGEHGNWHKGARGHGPEQQLAWLSDKLKLTDDQKSQIKPILEDEHKQLAALREDSSLSREQKHAKFREVHTSTFDKIRPLLTEQQQATLQQIQTQREERMKARRQKDGESSAPQNP
jgi:Spy/CpxP family protein refolding chaperone